MNLVERLNQLFTFLSSAVVVSMLYFAYRWFLRATDVTIGYNWSWKGIAYWPNFDLRNRSGSKTYVLGNIAYTKNKGKEIVAFDNQSLWGHELKPGTIIHLSALPVPSVHSMAECLRVEVVVRMQSGREFKAQGPGQLVGGWRRYAIAMRQRIEGSSLPLAN